MRKKNHKMKSIRMANKDRRLLRIYIFWITHLLLLSATATAAQQKPALVIKTTVEKEISVRKDGKEVLERTPVEKTSPGDILVYTIIYQNNGQAAAIDPTIVDPIPSGVIYVQNTAEGSDAEITCSIDNGDTWNLPPIMVQQKKSNGSLESRPAPMEKYTHIRWIIKKPVQPGQSGHVSFKAAVK